MIPTGSYCERCEREKQRQRPQRRSAYARNQWAKAIKERDGWQCRVRGCRTPTYRVEAHHKRPVALGGADTMENGITLCWHHHQAIHREQHGGAAAESA